jgi:hypothetical protein
MVFLHAHLRASGWSFVKLYTVVVHYLQMCMKEYGCCPKFKRGDNSNSLGSISAIASEKNIFLYFPHMVLC